MKTNILKIQKRHQFLFEIFYAHILHGRRKIRVINKLQKMLKQKADELYGWEDDRETYDACVVAICYLSDIKESIKYELTRYNYITR